MGEGREHQPNLRRFGTVAIRSWGIDCAGYAGARAAVAKDGNGSVLGIALRSATLRHAVYNVKPHAAWSYVVEATEGRVPEGARVRPAQPGWHACWLGGQQDQHGWRLCSRLPAVDEVQEPC